MAGGRAGGRATGVRGRAALCAPGGGFAPYDDTSAFSMVVYFYLCLHGEVNKNLHIYLRVRVTALLTSKYIGLGPTRSIQ